MFKLYQRPRSNRWQISYHQWNEEKQNLVRVRVSSGTDDRKEAEALAQGLESAAMAARPLSGSSISKDHAQGLLFNLLSTAGITIEGSEPLPFLRPWVNEFLESRRTRINNVSFRTYKTSRNKLLAWLDELNLKSEPRLDWLTPQRAEDYYSWLRESLAIKSAKEHFKWFSRVMKRAVEKTSLAKNPLDGIELDAKGITLDRLPFSLPEARQIMEFLLTGNERMRQWGRAAALSLMSGCRLEDAVTMDQGSIVKGVLTYQQHKTGKVIACPLVVAEWLSVIIETKKGPVSPTLFAEFQKRQNASLSPEFTGLVSEAGIEQKFTVFKNGRKVARKTFHSLRHTLRTAIVSSGGSDAQADVVLGHSKGQGKTYTHNEVEAMRRTLSAALKE